jgi:nucleotide-binding universal stress UspA family protein
MFTGLIVICVAVLLPTTDVASSASIMFLFLFFLVNVSVIKIRLHMGDELSYGFIMPFFPWLPIIAIICQGILAVWLVHMSKIAWIVAPFWILSGIATYVFYSRSHAITTADEVQVLEEEKEPETEQYHIMVPVANPENAIPMIKTTYTLSEAKNAKVKLLHMVPVPEAVPLSDAEKFMLEGKEGMIEVMLSLMLKFPITTTIWYCRNIARGILSAVREKKVDMLIMGWHGKPKGRTSGLGSTLDVLIERAPCNLVILKDCGNREFRSILVPWGGGPNGILALEIASILAERDDSEIVAFTVNDPKRDIQIPQISDTNGKNVQISFDRIKFKVAQSSNVVEAILEEAKDHDLVVMGSTRDPVIQQMTRDSVAASCARGCGRPLILVKASGGLRSWIKRWL